MLQLIVLPDPIMLAHRGLIIDNIAPATWRKVVSRPTPAFPQPELISVELADKVFPAERIHEAQAWLID